VNLREKIHRKYRVHFDLSIWLTYANKIMMLENIL
jgi:hypothetical protein